MMETMAKIPDSTQTSLRQKLLARATERWPQIQTLHTRYRAGFAYIDATLTHGEELKLCRLGPFPFWWTLEDERRVPAR